MKAAVINQFGDTDVLKFEDIAVPSPKPGHILIKVLAAGTNRLEHYLREGSVVPELPFPHILGADAAGEVARLGQGVEGFDIGERVIPMPGFPTDEKDYDIYPASLAPSFTLPGLGIWGTYAQYIEVPARYTLKDDTGLSAEEVATLPMALATAVRAVKESAMLKPVTGFWCRPGLQDQAACKSRLPRRWGPKWLPRYAMMPRANLQNPSVPTW